VSALGACDRALAETLAYVQERKVFGKRVFELQNTRFKLAEASTKTEVLRAFVDQCVKEFDEGTLTTARASMAKWWGSEIQCEVIDECLQLHGGYGYMMDYTIAELYADARVQKIYAGTNEVMKELIARSLEQ
jgi:acyl-CoA dehydrogenase